MSRSHPASLRRIAASLTILAAAAGLSALVAAPASAAGTEVVQPVTYQGRTVTVRLHPVTLRAPSFEVLVQQADGSYARPQVAAERAYLGSVDGDPGAVASAVTTADGTLSGQVVYDRGATWRFRNAAVYETRGMTPTTTYKWPVSADHPERAATVAAGQIGTKTYRWDIGFDVSNGWFVDPRSGGASVAATIDTIELTVATMLSTYESNALLRPAIGRVVIRAAAAKDPYTETGGGLLGQIRSEWTANQADTPWDDVALLHTRSGGGHAFLGSVTGTNGVSENGGAGQQLDIVRHELGHTWGPDDNHTGSPEGPTINSGNAYARFDGTELLAILKTRDAVLKAASPKLAAEPGTFAEPLAPYAALDLLDDLSSGTPIRFRPTDNDGDANGDIVALKSVDSASHLGGSVTRSGNEVTYTPPTVTAANTVDWFEVVVQDGTGRTATGVVIARVDPAAPLAPASGWADHDVVPGVPYELTNRQSGLLAAAPAGASTSGSLVQRAGTDDRTRFTITRSGAGFRLQNVGSTLCMDVSGGATSNGAQVIHYGCHGAANQQWRIVDHPDGGIAIVSVSSGLCLAPKDASITTGATLVQSTCSRSTSQRWDLKDVPPPVSSWPAIAPPVTTVPYAFTNVGSHLKAAAPAGATSYDNPLAQREGTDDAARFKLIDAGSDTYLVKLVVGSANACVSDAAWAADAITYYCYGTTTDWQRWKLVANPAGGTSLINVKTGECLAVKGESTATGAVLTTVACSIARAARWTLDPQYAPATDWPAVAAPVTTVPYELANVGSGLVVGQPDGTTTMAAIAQRRRSGDPATRLMLTAAGTDAYTLRVASTTNSCLQVHYSSTSEGMDVTSWYCDTTSLDRRWKIVENPAGGRSLINVNSGRCLAVKDGSNDAGAILVQKTCSIDPAQRFDLAAQVAPVADWKPATIASGAQYAVTNVNSGLRVAAPVGATSVPSIAQRAGDDAAARMVITTAPDGAFTIRVASTTNGCLQVHYGSTSEGMDVTSWYCDTTSLDRRWKIVDNPAGGRSLINVNSGKCLAVKDGSKEAGAILVQKTCSIDPAQRWSLAAAA